ncbi:hypothetical protein ACQPW3_11370 [Actinosynnema sp. CA-248983]
MTHDAERLLAFDRRGREEWLIAHEPDVEADRPNWWRSMLWLSKQNATNPSGLPIERVLEWADLAAMTVGLMRDRQLISEQEFATELAWLSVGVAKRAGRVPPELSADLTARRCVAAIGRPLPGGDDPVADWRELPVEEIRELRRVKNLISPLRSLREQVNDPELRKQVDGWVGVFAKLP